MTYWLREGRSSNAEVDFVLAFEGQIVPIEVKAGGRGSLRPLHQFVGEKHLPLAVRFDSNPPSLQTVDATIQTDSRAVDVKYQLLSLPLYLVERVRDVVRDLPPKVTRHATPDPNGTAPDQMTRRERSG